MEIRDEDVLAVVDGQMARGHTLDEAVDWIGRTGWASREQLAFVHRRRAPVSTPPAVDDLLDEASDVTTVIARAAEAGYRVVIVLSGPEQAARQALQARIEHDVVDLNRERWFVLTGNDVGKDEDFRAGWHNVPDPMLADLPNKRILIVARKSAAQLRELKTWFARASPKVLAEAPVLIVDADVGHPAELNPLVQEVLVLLTARTHVGHVDTARSDGLR